MTAHTIVEKPAAPQITDRVRHYEVNLDAALELMPAGERLPELRAERVRWIARYEQFVSDLDRGCPAPWGAHVNEYLLVIALLGQRIAAEERRVAS